MPWLLTGDFNKILNNEETEGGPARWEGSFTAFRTFVSQNGLCDLKHSGNHLSWRAQGTPTSSDHALIILWRITAGPRPFIWDAVTSSDSKALILDVYQHLA